MTTATKSEWLEAWDPENEETWDKGLAWQTLWITTFTLTLAFASWFLASAIAPKLTNLGFDLSTNQLYWLVAVPGLAGGLMRIVWMTLPPIMGTRKMVTLTTLLLLIPVLGWAVQVQDPNTPYWVLLGLAFLSGIGGGAFSGFMPSTSYFFPRRLQGTALGLQAGIGNFGVSLVQLLTPWIIGFSLIGFLGGSQSMVAAPGKPPVTVWYQNAAYIYVPFIVVGAILAWTMLKSVPVKANVRQQFDIFNNPDTWYMTLLYIMTFGTFSGLSAQFGLLMKNLYGAGNTDIVQGVGESAQLLVTGYSVPDPVKFVFLGPLVGAGARVVFAPLTDRYGGARWTLVSGLGLIASIAYTMTALVPDTSSARGPRVGIPPLPVGDARDLPVRRDRQRLDVQADADDLRAPPGRWGDRLDRRHRRVRPVLLRGRTDPDVAPHVLPDRHRVRRHVRGHHLGSLRPARSPQAELNPTRG